jgi:16S rRNA (uracil1498-N3)-methyltransferase
MRAPRLFIAGPLAQATEITLPAAAAQHVISVLRLRPGAPLTLFDGRGGEWAASLVTADRRSAQVRVDAFSAVDRESRLQVTLLQGIARGERMDQLVQKATELGVARIIPVATERSVVQLEGPRAERRSAHWQAVAQSACEQCGRNRVPEVTTPLDLAAACGSIAATPLRWLLEPAATQPLVAAARAVRDRRDRALDRAGGRAHRCRTRASRALRVPTDAARTSGVAHRDRRARGACRPAGGGRRSRRLTAGIGGDYTRHHERP